MVKMKLPDMTNWSNEQIAEFWATHSASDFEDELEEIEIHVNAPIKEQVTFRLDGKDIQAIKRMAEKKGIGHTTLIRMWVKEKLESVTS